MKVYLDATKNVALFKNDEQSFYLDPYSIPSKNRPNKIEVMDLVVTIDRKGRKNLSLSFFTF